MCAQPVPESPGRPRITPIQWVGLAALILLFLWSMGLLGQEGPNGIGNITSQIPRFVALVLAITVHEFSHGFVATLFGDDLPRRVGRLTLNPLKHLDPIGTIMILIGPIGWGKPMPINPSGMRNPSLGWALSSIAGPISNILSAAVVVLVVSRLDLGTDAASIEPYIEAFLGINVALAVFNLIPLPPLDGFGFFYGLAPTPVKLALAPIQQYGMFILLAVLFLPMTQPYVYAYLRMGQLAIGRFLAVLAGG